MNILRAMGMPERETHEERVERVYVVPNLAIEGVAYTLIKRTGYANYDPAAEEAFMQRSRLKRARRLLEEQLQIARRRGFASTKVPLDVLEALLVALSKDINEGGSA